MTQTQVCLTPRLSSAGPGLARKHTHVTSQGVLELHHWIPRGARGRPRRQAEVGVLEKGDRAQEILAHLAAETWSQRL